MENLSWDSLGSFSIARGTHTLLAKLPFFDEMFRDYARNQRARWDGLEKAWVFPSNKEQDVLSMLQKMSAERDAKRQALDIGNEAIAERLKTCPFNFQSLKLTVTYDPENQRFLAKFPYNEQISFKLRQVGGRWNPTLKCHTVPLGGLEVLEALTEAPRREQALFVERNAPWLAKEQSDPIAPLTTALGNEHVIKVEADIEKLTYKVTFPFAIDSILGREVIGASLHKLGAFDPVRPEDVDRHYPKVNLHSIIFEMSQRDKIDAISTQVISSLSALGPCSKFDILVAFVEGGRWRGTRAEPEPGEIIFRDHKAWLVAKANKSKTKVSIQVHPITATQAQTRLEAMASTMQERCCDLSGIDFDSLFAYVEKLYLHEASRELPAVGSAKPIRL